MGKTAKYDTHEIYKAFTVGLLFAENMHWKENVHTWYVD